MQTCKNITGRHRPKKENCLKIQRKVCYLEPILTQKDDLKDAVKQTKGNTEPGFFAIALSNNLSKISATIIKEVP
jgi:hypothetical protein